MASSKKTEDGGHIIDVKRPGSATPSSTSKPVIVTNRPILKDPMVVPEEDKEAKPADQQTAPAARKSVLEPLAEPATDEKPAETPAEADAKAAEPASEAAISEETKPAEAEAEVTTEPAPKETTEVPAAGETKPSDDKDEGATNSDAAAQAEAEKQAAHEAEIQKLVDSKQYFLSINSREKKRTKHFVLAGIMLSLILVVAWADIAMDAGLISVPGVKPLTHFFSN